MVTQGPRGAVLRWKRQWFRVPAYPPKEVDSTGAGDVFAAAYLVRYSKMGDPLTSGLYASCTASIKVCLPEIPTVAQIKEHASRHPELKVVPCRGPF